MLKIFENNQPASTVWQGLEAWPGQSEPKPNGGQVAVAPTQPRASNSIKTIALCGAAGGVGKTALAVNIAFELASAGYRVAVADLDLINPNLLAAFGQEPITAGVAGAHRLISQGRFSPADLERLMMVLNFDGVRLWILPGLSAPATASVLAEYAKSANDLLAELAKNFDYVLVDLPSVGEANELIKTCLDTCDLSFAVVGAEPAAIQRYLWAQPKLQAGLSNQLQVIVNHLRDAVIGADAKRQIADTLQRAAAAEVVAFVPQDTAAFDTGLLTGLPLSLAKKASPARHAVSMFVRQGLLGQRTNLDWRLLRG